MAFYVSWNHQFERVDLGKTEEECKKCGSNQMFTVRLYWDKTKLYGFATIRKKRFVTLTCHGCLTEFEAADEYQQEVINYYDTAIEEQKLKEKEARSKGKT